MKKYYIMNYYEVHGFKTREEAENYCKENGIDTREIFEL